MKVSDNFDIREFVPPETWAKWGVKSIWFVNKKLFPLAEFYKQFFKQYYKADNVLIAINTYLFDKTANAKTLRGYRPPDTKTGGFESQHKFCNAFDCDIFIIKGQEKKEADYKEIQAIIKANEKTFMAAGLTTIESVEFAPTWLHSDCRNTGLDTILIVKP